MSENNADGPEGHDEERDGPGTSRRATIAAVIALAGLIAIGLWLGGVLRGVSTIQDCAMAGRSNCAPVR